MLLNLQYPVPGRRQGDSLRHWETAVRRGINGSMSYLHRHANWNSIDVSHELAHRRYGVG